MLKVTEKLDAKKIRIKESKYYYDTNLKLNIYHFSGCSIVSVNFEI